jgi:hypothetical protein
MTLGAQNSQVLGALLQTTGRTLVAGLALGLLLSLCVGPY